MFSALAVVRAVPPPSPLEPHPRVVLTHARVDALQAAIAGGGDAAVFSEQLFAHAAWVLTMPPQERGTPDSSGVLIHVRNALDFLLTSAVAHRLNSSGGVYLARAVAEGLNLAQNWSDWNTVQHALDTGEALLAMGLAYDWLYQDLTPEQRTVWLGDGIVTRGLIPYKTYIGTSTFWWVNNSINWNCVCSSGGVISVLSTLGDAGLPDWAWGSIVDPLIVGVRPCIAAYNSDSSWEEGPGYWGYASKYNAWLFAGLTNVLGSTLNLTEIPGVEGAALFPLYSTGAGALTGTAEQFNWADSISSQAWTPFAQWWGGAPFFDAAAAWWSRAGSRLLGPASLKTPAWGGYVESLTFFTPLGSAADVVKLPTAKLYDFINVGVLRGAWAAPPAEQHYVSFKGGDSGWNHNHLDLSTFVYDLAGVRLAEDMGADSYELPGYFGPQRWDYYRLNSRGHNVLMFGNASQAHPVVAPITFFNGTESSACGGWAIIDVTLAYAASGTVSRARRGFAAAPGVAAIVVVDELEYVAGAAAPPANVTWAVHTRAAPTLAAGGGVALTRGGVVGALAVLPRATACASLGGWAFVPLAPLLPSPPFDSAAGFTRVELAAALPAGADACTLIAVALGDPGAVAALAAGDVRPLDDWPQSGPFYK
jgi:hypothetical protein